MINIIDTGGKNVTVHITAFSVDLRSAILWLHENSVRAIDPFSGADLDLERLNALMNQCSNKEAQYELLPFLRMVMGKHDAYKFKLAF